MLSFEALLFTIAIAFILLAMAKERTEYRHKTAALEEHRTDTWRGLQALKKAVDGGDLFHTEFTVQLP